MEVPTGRRSVFRFIAEGAVVAAEVRLIAPPRAGVTAGLALRRARVSLIRHPGYLRSELQPRNSRRQPKSCTTSAGRLNKPVSKDPQAPVAPRRSGVSFFCATMASPSLGSRAWLGRCVAMKVGYPQRGGADFAISKTSDEDVWIDCLLEDLRSIARPRAN
jgi:hypothetical protein